MSVTQIMSNSFDIVLANCTVEFVLSFSFLANSNAQLAPLQELLSVDYIHSRDGLCQNVDNMLDNSGGFLSSCSCPFSPETERTRRTRCKPPIADDQPLFRWRAWLSLAPPRTGPQYITVCHRPPFSYCGEKKRAK